MLVLASCKKDADPNMEHFQVLKEKEKIAVGTDWMNLRGEYAFSGVVDSMKLRVGTEEHLWGSDDYDLALEGKSYSLEITGLQPGILYYYSYIVNYGSKKDWLSEIYTFTTVEEEISLPTVTTMEVIGVTTKAATCVCTVVDDGGAEVTERGICWSTHDQPDVFDFIYANGEGCGQYAVNMSQLDPNTDYYVRAYAKNRRGIGYGAELTFTTKEELEPPMGAINGLFSVSEDQQVWFSQGNLMYRPSNRVWGFAEFQYLYVGNDNENVSEGYIDWIDLFGWGTSGYDHGSVCYQPWSTTSASDMYYAYGSEDYSLFDQDGQADWGYGVRIGVEDEQSHPWRTLTNEEWIYLFHERNTSTGIRYAKAQVDGVNGVLLLPDDWNSAYFALNNVNQDYASYASNDIMGYAFDTYLEPNGAVFLPAAGRRSDVSVMEAGSCGYYWSSSALSAKKSMILTFENDFLDPDVSMKRYMGCSVRLVWDAEY